MDGFGGGSRIQKQPCNIVVKYNYMVFSMAKDDISGGGNVGSAGKFSKNS